MKKNEPISPFEQKIRVLTKLYESGCKTEKDLQSLTIETILKIPDITVPDMTIIMELQKKTKANKLFTYLGGENDEPTADGNG